MYDARLGRLRFATIIEPFAEQVGGDLESVGSATVPGGRRPTGYTLNLPLWGDGGDPNPYPAGMRIRRQARSLLRNPLARAAGLYFTFTYDAEMNGWLAVGNGEVAYDEGGVTHSSFVLNLSEVFLIGAARTHRQGSRIEMTDRRLTTTARDYLRLVYSNAFVGQSATATHYFPIGATDLTGKVTGAVGSSTVSSIYGSMAVVTGRQHGETIAYELPESERGKADVVVFDRRTFTAPTFTLAGDQDSQTVYGWEEVYGPDYPYTAGDVPVLANGRCRVIWTSGSSFNVQTSSGSAYSTDGSMSLGFSDLVHASVVEWTPERAVVKATFLGGPGRGDVYITLQRGWAGPSFDVYPQNSSGTGASTSLSYSGGLSQMNDSATGWQYKRLGVGQPEYLWDTRMTPEVIAR